MAVAYILAHFDDEYCALPLIRAQLAAGEDLWFVYVADYADPGVAARRHRESRALLGRLGVTPERVVLAGAGTGAVDGRVHRALPAAFAAVESVLARTHLTEIVVTAYEGGHMDHDCCAAIAVGVARMRGGLPVRQFSLYNGPGLPWRLFHGCAPLPQNGPVSRLPLSAGDWLWWMAAVRAFPSQFDTWLGLWPAMFWTLLRRGFGVQDLAPGRVAQRPHDGPLLYERMFGVAYPEVRAAIDALGA